MNLWVIQENLPMFKYGHCLAGLRLRHPSAPIYLSKYDFDSAFCHCHMSSKTALKSCSAFDDLLLVSPWLTFGRTPCPNLRKTIGEPVCDLANEVIHNSQWDHSSLYDPLSLQLLVPKRLPPDKHFGQALPLAVAVPVDNKGKGDIYIDDSIFIYPGLYSNIKRIAKAVPLAIIDFARPIFDDEPLPQMKKIMAEVSLEECKMVLGWLINTRSFTIYLPENKVISWSSNIDAIISAKKASSKTFHTVEGRLNHAAYAIPTMHHFLSRLRALCMLSEKVKTIKSTFWVQF